MAKIKKTEVGIILEFIQLGRGNIEEKKALAKELGITFSGLKYKVKNFKVGNGVGRKKRADAGIPKKDPELQIKRAFFAEMAMGISADKAGEMLGLTEHQTNILSKEFNREDKLMAIRNAPQLEDLQELIKDVFRIDMAIVSSEMNGNYSVEFGETKLKIPVEQLHDLKVILAYCLQKDEMGKIDPRYEKFKKEDLENVRVFYLKQELLEKKNVKDFAALKRATSQTSPERQLDLKLMYAVINRFNPGLDEQSKLNIIKDEALKLKMIK